MNRFYVYTLKSSDPYDRGRIYVDETRINRFALHNFEPASMEYSGVLIEADTPEEANVIYSSFDGDIIWADEPVLTASRTDAFKNQKVVKKELDENLTKAELTVKRLRVHVYSKGIAADLIGVNERISRMAEVVRDLTEANPEVTIEQLYDRLKKKYIEQLSNDKYDSPGSGSEG